MNHLDEGTIHAWLDGALDATQSSAVEAHVAQCDECSSLVAEARGLVAAASRIMSALDDVPGGVIPAGVPAAAVSSNAAAVRSLAEHRTKRSAWRVTRWASGIAAVLIGAIVLSTTHEAERASMEIAQPVVVTDGPIAPVPQPDTAAIRETAMEKVSDAQAPAAPSVERATKTTNRERQASAPKAEAPSAANAGAGEAARRIQPSLGEVRPAPVPGVAITSDSARMRDVRESVRAESRFIPPPTDVRTLAVETPALDAVERLAGCYSLARAENDQRGAVAGAVADVGRRARAAVTRPAPSAAPSAPPSAQSSEFSASAALAVIRLDTARAALGLAVVSVVNDTIGSWRVLRDTARVDLGTRGVIMLPLSAKVSCPNQ